MFHFARSAVQVTHEHRWQIGLELHTRGAHRQACRYGAALVFRQVRVSSSPHKVRSSIIGSRLVGIAGALAIHLDRSVFFEDQRMHPTDQAPRLSVTDALEIVPAAVPADGARATSDRHRFDCSSFRDALQRTVTHETTGTASKRLQPHLPQEAKRLVW